MKTRVVLTVGLIALLAVAMGYAQETVKVNISFPFTVAGKALPAGTYQFVRDSMGEAFTVQGEGKNGALAPILTRITKDLRGNPQSTHLVFDVVGDTYVLSEIWVPNEDGYVMVATKGKHGHKVVEGM